MRPPLILFVLLAIGAGWWLARARARRRRARRGSWEAFAIAAALVALSLPIGALIGRPDLVPALLVRDDAPIGAVDAVFVASGDVDFVRTRHAARVFSESGARWFLLSGGGAGGDNAREMAAAARSFGVPEVAILVEDRATTSRENALFSRSLLRDDIRAVAVVTDRLHSRRFAWTVRRAWPSRVRVLAATVPAAQDPLACQSRDWRREPVCRRAVQREWAKLFGYFAQGWI